MSQLRSRPAPVLLAIVLLVATAATASAQTTPRPAPTTATTKPTSPPTTCLLLCSPTSSATTSPPTSNGPSPTVGPAPPTTSPGGGGDGEPPPGTPRVVPPDAQRQIDSVRRTGPNNTSAWLAALQPLVTEFGMTPTDAAMAGAVHFPIAGPTTWVDDWHYPRFVPSFHLHKGLDMFAASGTPVRAPFDGLLKMSDGAVGGLAAYVTQPDGTYVYMAHLSAYAPDKVTGQAVRQGEVVGFVGDTGNARGGSPHVHLQLHPKGGNPAPPKPTVDAWLAEATANVPQLIAATRAARTPPADPAAGASVTALPDGTTSLSEEAAPAVDPAAALWAASSNPAIGTIDLASSLVASAAEGMAWPAPPG
ncbi:MAG: hypothetical protein AVDCRST_MAG76-671 [uncultured Acidimicrobiales bacterium]|uniref:M23ase beta-sheet core domain-containing protein n=1 Tax=uncultured Acidimicrobiales bacterium TaxID=310071 RepID=A0A6J4HED3_9ACTN|nr:MAG: hypothetical protein AVDCRST_MAG76-671 [uncultured Acidimicrobiales bacterium]